MSNTSTQIDRIVAVLLCIVYLGGLFYFLDAGKPETVLAYYTTAGAVVVVPIVIYLLSRVFSFKGISDKLSLIEHQTNGRLTQRLEAQTEEIVRLVIDGLQEIEERNAAAAATPRHAADPGTP